MQMTKEFGLIPDEQDIENYLKYQVSRKKLPKPEDFIIKESNDASELDEADNEPTE